MDFDFPIVLNFEITTNTNIKKEADFLVKTARNIGIRAVSGSPFLKEACQKYMISLIKSKKGQYLNASNVIETIIQNKKTEKQTIINVLSENRNFNPETKKMLNTINSWIHLFGHAINEGRKSNLAVTQDGFVLENHHVNYQKYVFLKQPLPQQIVVSGLTKKPNQVEWVQDRIDPPFTFKNNKLTITLTNYKNDFPWQVLRIQAHRPEDDIVETKF